MSKIILINGPSATGKSSLAKAIQHLSEEPWLTFGFDALLRFMPDKYFGVDKKASQGFNFVSSVDKEGFPLIEVKTGSYGDKVSNSGPKIVRQLADDGHNLILDEVICEKKDLERYAAVLKNHQVYYVKVNCELPLMEEREILRGDRSWGFARFQNAKMANLNWNYDLEINTSQNSSFANAKKILESLKKIKN